MESSVRKRVVSYPLEDFTFRPVSSPSRPATRRLQPGISPRVALGLLIAARLASAVFNIIHDCDETYNYVEPLHYLLYGYGLQTWEYSAEFAMRAYIYLLLHALVGAPAAALFGAGAGKVAVFYTIKVALALASALTEWWLYRAVQRQYSAAVANSFLLLLCVSAGMFVSSTGFLPSSFTMYALTAAAAAVLEGRPYPVIAAAVIGVIWGWAVAGVAFLPYALYVLCTARFSKAVGVALLWLLGTLGPLALVDRLFYKKWAPSLYNFVYYNVAGGGESALYGVEAPSFYLRNGFNNFSLALPLALLLPALALLSGFRLRLGLGGSSKGKAAGTTERRSTLRLLVCVSPLFVWLAAITALPHKEERFLYVAYPLLCLSAAASLTVLVDWAARALSFVLPARAARALPELGSRALLAVVALLAVSRSAAQVLNYGAPLNVYRHLPEVPPGSPQVSVCVGAEWHRFPGSFFLPGPTYRLQFIKSGFTGLLPRQFNDTEGGTAAAPRQLNNKNREEPKNYWATLDRCDYVVTLRDGKSHVDKLVDESSLKWDTVASQPFVDVAQSPPLARAFFIPGWSHSRNHYVEYLLLKQRR